MAHRCRGILDSQLLLTPQTSPMHKLGASGTGNEGWLGGFIAHCCSGKQPLHLLLPV